MYIVYNRKNKKPLYCSEWRYSAIWYVKNHKFSEECVYLARVRGEFIRQFIYPDGWSKTPKVGDTVLTSCGTRSFMVQPDNMSQQLDLSWKVNTDDGRHHVKFLTNLPEGKQLWKSIKRCKN